MRRNTKERELCVPVILLIKGKEGTRELTVFTQKNSSYNNKINPNLLNLGRASLYRPPKQQGLTPNK